MSAQGPDETMDERERTELKQRMQRLDRMSETLAKELGVSLEQGYAALAIVAEEARKAKARTQPTKESQKEKSPWHIPSLFPRPTPGLSALGGAERGEASHAETHENPDQELKLTARRTERMGGILLDLELHATWADGSPAEGLTIVLHAVAEAPRQEVTNAQGEARFSGLRNVQPERWQVEVRMS